MFSVSACCSLNCVFPIYVSSKADTVYCNAIILSFIMLTEICLFFTLNSQKRDTENVKLLLSIRINFNKFINVLPMNETPISWTYHFLLLQILFWYDHQYFFIIHFSPFSPLRLSINVESDMEKVGNMFANFKIIYLMINQFHKYSGV